MWTGSVSSPIIPPDKSNFCQRRTDPCVCTWPFDMCKCIYACARVRKRRGREEEEKGGLHPRIGLFRGRNTNCKYYTVYYCTGTLHTFLSPCFSLTHAHAHTLSRLITASEHAIHQSRELVKGWMEPSSLQSELLDFPPVTLCIPVWPVVVIARL